MSDRTIGGLTVDMKISLGNMITIGILVVTIVAGWIKLQSQTDQHAIDIAKNTTRIERLETGYGEVKDRLTRIEVTLQNVSVQVDRVVSAVERKPLDMHRQ